MYSKCSPTLVLLTVFRYAFAVSQIIHLIFNACMLYNSRSRVVTSLVGAGQQ